MIETFLATSAFNDFKLSITRIFYIMMTNIFCIPSLCFNFVLVSATRRAAVATIQHLILANSITF